MEDIIKKYDTVFKDVGYRSLKGSQGMFYLDKLCSTLKFKSVLDVGCGPGWSVIEFLKRGKEARGVEPCKYLFGQELRVPAGLGIVKEGAITSIPFPADSFDMVFCTDVLEHLVESEVNKALSELVRVSKKYIFCSICSTEAVMFPDMKLHQTVKPREWWEKQFAEFKLKQIKVEDKLGYLFVRIP